ncbi:MAG: hypothetical protein AAGU01_04480, partial [Clostridiaceae bacterium]
MDIEKLLEELNKGV